MAEACVCVLLNTAVFTYVSSVGAITALTMATTYTGLPATATPTLFTTLSATSTITITLSLPLHYVTLGFYASLPFSFIPSFPFTLSFSITAITPSIWSVILSFSISFLYVNISSRSFCRHQLLPQSLPYLLLLNLALLKSNSGIITFTTSTTIKSCKIATSVYTTTYKVVRTLNYSSVIRELKKLTDLNI